MSSARNTPAGQESSQDEVTVIRPWGLKRTIGGTSVGNMMEWYDFGIFAFLVPPISQVFFGGTTSAGSLVATFTMFAAAFVVRPLGGLFFGPLGDRIGRRRVLAITMITMAIGTLSIGLIPGAAAIGAWAPVLLLLARLVQGFSTGGEYAGAMTYLGEHAPDTRRGFLASWLEFGTLCGYVLGAAVATGITAVVPQEALLSWGWRIPFLIAGPLGLVGLYVRTRLEESPAYEEHVQDRDQQQDSVGEQLHDTVVKPWRPLLICVGLVLAFNVTNYTLTQYMPTYLSEEVGVAHTPALLIVLAVMVILMGLVTVGGWLSDRVGRNPILYVGCALLLVLSVPAFFALSQGGYVLVFLGTLLLGLTLLCFNSTLPAALPALFPVGVRYGSLAIAFNVSVAVFGGTTPLIAAALVATTGSELMPAFLLVGAGVIGAVAVYFTRESAGRPMPGSAPSAANDTEAREIAAENQREAPE
ncbi:MHS family proline/betaine transporter-like MFS transporter [Saccharopolyspora lacisalsi]|uniref:Putative proline/betaine transporter n=1 Tax=Halosaccharopolyspora lacisalsi TaxID=1000566 RepID=A0A839DT59_9PSEU|nr:MFS transporter [Halosaccharopolyspora lacisalsi]MBA8824130.1 MHS family proline/betaine transporter-like MFS transporter [Halosaccharopolyspora lacisalsi]